MRFLFIGSRFTLRTSFPRSVTLTQLYFASLVVTNLRRDLHPQVCAHAGRTIKKTGPQGARFYVGLLSPPLLCQISDRRRPKHPAQFPNALAAQGSQHDRPWRVRWCR